ncbi:MAG: NAD-dependent epimerase/dehydratase family protein, partial [Acholeplasmataceae bacterium]|nr:NAD-dependent epimerase/dehydratase family protein [Acholeplasmataceae bacterium]
MYIVTGATGHIGNSIVRCLLQHHETVRVLVRRTDISLNQLFIDLKIGDLSNEAFLDENIQRGDILIHSAGFIDLFNSQKLQSFRTNYHMTKKIVEVCERKGVRLIYISSVDALPKQKKGKIQEPILLNPRNHKYYYAKSKALATQYIMDRIPFGLSATILYPSAVIGINDYKPSAVGQEVMSALNHRILFSIKGGYNFIDVRDVSLAIYRASKMTSCDHIILSGYDKTVTDLYKTIESVSKKKKRIIRIPTFLVRFIILFYKKYSQMMITIIQSNHNYDNRRMKEMLLPELISFEQTILDTIIWLKDQENNKR